MSRINSFKRDWSSSQETSLSTPSSQGSQWAPPPPSAGLTGNGETEVAKASRARRLELIEAALRGDSAPLANANGKRSAPIDVDDLDDRGLPGPSAPKKRVLPWEHVPSVKPSQRDFLSKHPAVSNSVAAAKTIPAKPTVVELSSEQRHILNLVLEGKNIFYTGSAGTGKSVLLRQIIADLKKKHPAGDAVAVTASTGIAACNIGGVTLHSFAGIGLGAEKAEVLAGKVRKNRKAMSRWTRTRVLIIDEISMVDGALFDKLATVACELRGSSKPFGGLQLIVTGDFFQLPPVMKDGTAKFAFEAEKWNDVIQHTFNLTQVFRQKDPTFVNMLNEMRFGRLSQQSIQRFRGLSRPLRFNDGVAATELFPRREDVDNANQTQLRQLDSQRQPVYTYTALDGGTAEEQTRARLLQNFMAVPSLRLTVGAQVMLIKNMEDTSLVNGSTGIVTRFVDPAPYRTESNGNGGKPQTVQTGAGGGKLYPVVSFKIMGENAGTREITVMPDSFKVELPNGEIQASRTQLPLILSWAMSIHKSQGQTLDRVKVDLGKVFEKGQAYVALSRATSLEGLQVLNFEPSKVQAHPKVVEWTKTLQCVQV